jgi:hypothetical protein
MLLADLRSAPAMTIFAIAGITAALLLAVRLLDHARRLTQEPDDRLGRLARNNHPSSCTCRICVTARLATARTGSDVAMVARSNRALRGETQQYADAVEMEQLMGGAK